MASRGLSHEALQFRARRGQLHESSPEAVAGGAQLAGPWFNTASGAKYLAQPTRNAFRMWAQRHGVIPIRRAGLVLYAKADIDRVLGLTGRRCSA
jgi:hypothetical protein